MNRTNKALELALLIALFLPSGAAIGQPGDATVFIYRYRQLVARAAKPPVYCDDVKLAKIENGRYFSVSVAPGKHLFRSADKQSVIAIDAKPGERYFIRAYNIWTTGGMLMVVDPDQGRAELSSGKIKPLDKGSVIATDRVSVRSVDFKSGAP